MKNRFQFLALIISLTALAAGYSLQRMYQQKKQDEQQLAEALAVSQAPTPDVQHFIGKAMPAFLLPDLQNVVRSSDEWQGKVLLINFWASWCAPCRKEMPLFVEFQNRYQAQGLQIIGIAMDSQQMAYEFSREVSTNYPILYGSEKVMRLGKAFGNARGTLPYSVFVDRQGAIRQIHFQGELKEAQLLAYLQPLLQADTQ